MKNNQKTWDEVLTKFQSVHHGRYSYDTTTFTLATKKMRMYCVLHGEFWQLPLSHSRGRGCPECGRATLSKVHFDTLETFINKAMKVHGTRYEYMKSIYKGSQVAVTISCKIHGDFRQLPTHHVRGCGCPSCARGKWSVMADRWLDSVGIAREQREIWFPNLRIVADGFDPITNTIYEFWGGFWHGDIRLPKFSPERLNPKSGKTFGQLYEETQAKRHKILDAGYRLEEIWEHDFLK